MARQAEEGERLMAVTVACLTLAGGIAYIAYAHITGKQA